MKMLNLRSVTCALAGVAMAGFMAATPALADGLNVSPGNMSGSRTGAMSASDMANAKSAMPMITDAKDLPPVARKMLGLDGADGKAPAAYGTGGWPFTTKLAGSRKKTDPGWLKAQPWRPIGKLWMRKADGWYVCTATVIDKGILVTAAHCVHDYGMGAAGWVLEVRFEPVRHHAYKPVGTWYAVDWYIPTVYYNGTDTCTVSGVVCENDVAVVVMDTSAGSYIAQKTGRHATWHDNYGYTSFAGETATHITQFGYPVALEGGVQMIRTDSVGFQDTPSNVTMGSDQSGGSSGGPWFINFGYDYSSTDPAPTAAVKKVMATTSWGYTSGTVKIQGASRFAKNGAYPATSNIQSLRASACSAYPGHCY